MFLDGKYANAGMLLMVARRMWSAVPTIAGDQPRRTATREPKLR